VIIGLMIVGKTNIKIIEIIKINPSDENMGIYLF
jgi:hypothetical protein